MICMEDDKMGKKKRSNRFASVKGPKSYLGMIENYRNLMGFFWDSKQPPGNVLTTTHTILASCKGTSYNFFRSSESFRCEQNRECCDNTINTTAIKNLDNRSC